MQEPEFPDALQTLRLSHDTRVAHLVLNRPEKRNALNRLMLRELGAALDWIAGQSARVTVLSGAGPSFCAGADLSDRPPGSAEGDAASDYADLRSRLDQLFAIWRHPKPVVAAVQGDCLGFGSILAALADITVVAEDARIGIPALPLGGGMLTPTWVHLIGPKRAKQVAFEVGGSLSGTEAEAWGFANFAVPATELAAVAHELAVRYARTPAGLLMLKKAAINRMVELSGLTVGAQVGALTDTVAHEVAGLSPIRESIRDHGVRQTVADFQSGRLDV
jgi:enoyl-CoA hydratase